MILQSVILLEMLSIPNPSDCWMASSTCCFWRTNFNQGGTKLKANTTAHRIYYKRQFPNWDMYLSQSQTSVNEAVSHEIKCWQRYLVCHCLYTAILQTKNDVRQQIMMCQLWFLRYFFVETKTSPLLKLFKSLALSNQSDSVLLWLFRPKREWTCVVSSKIELSLAPRKIACSLFFCLNTVTKCDCYVHLLVQIKARTSVWVNKMSIQAFCQR